jgi:hypothetical protein
MPVEAIGGDVELAVGEPGMFDFAGVGIPGEFAGVAGWGEPVEGPGLFEPEGFGFAEGTLVEGVELGGVEMGPLNDLGRGGKGAAFVGERIGGNGVF